MSYLKTVYNRKREPKTTYPRKLVEYLVARFRLKKIDKTLELGMGNGDLLVEFYKRGFECYGVDKEISITNNPGIVVKRIDISKTKLPFPDNYFDTVYHKSVLEHFYRNEVDFVMKETRRVLKKRGKLIILVPDWESQMKTFFEDYTQVHPYSSMAISDLLSIYDFKKVNAEKFYQLPLIWKFPRIKILAEIYSLFVSTAFARKLAETTGLKLFRWSKELMVLGYGEK